MKAAYLLIDAVSLAFPLAFSGTQRFGFGRRWPRACAAVALASVPFILWDIAFARAGVWDFNPRYVLGPSAFGLPLEEILFFLAIPFACLFIYRQFAGPPGAPGPDRERPGPAFALGFGALAAALAALAAANAHRPYTLCVGLAGSAAAAGLAWARPRFGRPLLPALAVQYAPFLIVNGLLTALPVVRYRADAILGPRIFTIPVEDAVYSFVMLVIPVSIYEFLVSRTRRPVPPVGAPAAPFPASAGVGTP